MSNLDNTKRNAAIVRQYKGSRAIKREAESITGTDDTVAASHALQDAAANRKNSTTAFDNSGRHRLAIALVLISITVMVVLITWAAASPAEFTGTRLYGALVVAALAVWLAIWSGNRARKIREADAAFPTVLESGHITEADRFVNVFGAHSGTDGNLFLTLGGAAEGAVAGWVIASALGTTLPAALQIFAAITLATLTVLGLQWILRRYATQVRALRAKLRVRSTKRIDFARYPDKKAELDYLCAMLEPLCNDGFKAPTWRDWAKPVVLIMLVVTMFVLIVVVRAMAPDQTEGSFQVLVGTSILCCFLTVLGLLLSGAGHLLPEQARVATAINRRFPSIPIFSDWQRAEHRSIDRWANGVARSVNVELKKRQERGDHRWVDLRLEVPRPFPLESASDEPASKANADEPPASAMSQSNMQQPQPEGAS